MVREGFTCQELGTALKCAPTSAPRKAAKACAGMVRQLRFNVYLALGEIQRAAELDAAGDLPSAPNWPAVKFSRMLRADPARAFQELLNAPEWSETEIETLQHVRGNRHLPWLR
ncbi:MAG: hypothetical protein GY778_13730 [bacterium]|nr:hypothetical protein [bacterium]